jgi:hypothetical protein
MNTPSNITDPRARRWAVVAKYGALLAVGFAAAPYVFTAITGLIGLVVAGALMLGTWMLLPFIGDAAANFRLRLIKAEASKNPIETLENESLRRAQLLQVRQEKIESLAAKTAGFGSKLQQFKRDFPADAQSYQEIYDKMVELLKRSRDQWKIADAQKDQFDREIVRAKAKWAMAIAASDLRKDAGQVESEFFAKLRVESSLDSIEMGMNSAFAQLDTLLMESESVQALPSGERPAINVTSTVKSTVQ